MVYTLPRIDIVEVGFQQFSAFVAFRGAGRYPLDSEKEGSLVSWSLTIHCALSLSPWPSWSASKRRAPSWLRFELSLLPSCNVCAASPQKASLGEALIICCMALLSSFKSHHRELHSTVLQCVQDAVYSVKDALVSVHHSGVWGAAQCHLEFWRVIHILSCVWALCCSK